MVGLTNYGVRVKFVFAADEEALKTRGYAEEKIMLLKLATGWESWQEFAPWALKLVLVTSFLVVEFALLAPNAGSLAVTLLLGGA